MTLSRKQQKIIACIVCVMMVFTGTLAQVQEAQAMVFAPALWSIASTLLLRAGVQFASQPAVYSTVQALMNRSAIFAAELNALIGTVGVGTSVLVTGTIANEINDYVDNYLYPETQNPTQSIPYIDTSSMAQTEPEETTGVISTIIGGSSSTYWGPTRTITFNLSSVQPNQEIGTFRIIRMPLDATVYETLTPETRLYKTETGQLYMQVAGETAKFVNAQDIVQSGDTVSLMIRTFYSPTAPAKHELKGSKSGTILYSKALSYAGSSAPSYKSTELKMSFIPAIPVTILEGQITETTHTLGQDVTVDTTKQAVANESISVLPATDVIGKSIDDLTIELGQIGENTGVTNDILNTHTGILSGIQTVMSDLSTWIKAKMQAEEATAVVDVAVPIQEGIIAPLPTQYMTQTMERLQTMNTEKGTPPKITIPMNRIFNVFSAITGITNPFPQDDYTLVDFAVLDNYEFGGLAVIDYFRGIIGFGLIYMTFLYVYRKVYPSQVIA